MHIEAYHSQINNQNRKEAAHKNPKRNLQELQEKNQKKISYFIKKEILTYRQHGTLMQNLKSLKRQVEPKPTGKEQIINTSQISTDTHHTSPELSSRKTAGRSQRPARTSAGKSHCPSRKS